MYPEVKYGKLRRTSATDYPTLRKKEFLTSQLLRPFALNFSLIFTPGPYTLLLHLPLLHPTVLHLPMLHSYLILPQLPWTLISQVLEPLFKSVNLTSISTAFCFLLRQTLFIGTTFFNKFSKRFKNKPEMKRCRLLLQFMPLQYSQVEHSLSRLNFYKNQV